MPAVSSHALCAPVRAAVSATLRRHAPLIRYGAVGAVCTALHLVAFLALHRLMRAEIANASAYLLSTQVNFGLSYTWTWRHRRSGPEPVCVVLRRFAVFNAAALAGLVVNSAAFWAVLHLLDPTPALCALVAVAVSTAFSYLASSRFTFASPAPGATIDGEMSMTTTPAPAHLPGTAFFLPAHDEAENLPRVVGAVVAHLQARREPFEVFVVDDGSTDATVAVVAGLTEDHPQVRLVSHGVNRGYGAALRTGLTHASAAGLGWVAFCDADGQFDPADLALLLAEAEASGADLVVGIRAQRADTLPRRVLGRCWQATSRAVLGVRVTDVDCGFKLFRTSSLLTYVDHLSGEHATISPEIVVRAQRSGARISQAVVPHHPRMAGHQSGADPAVMWTSFTGLLALRRQLAQPLLVIDAREPRTPYSVHDATRTSHPHGMTASGVDA